jgi:hypothetical protein
MATVNKIRATPVPNGPLIKKKGEFKGSTLKAGGKVKDKKWIQKAVNPAHKGFCTPMTKATCTPKRKALALTFKAMGRARKAK